MNKVAPGKKRADCYHHGNLRESLLLETERMLAANQLDQITLNELGKRLGVARSAPYRHFTNKNELLCEVATQAFGRMYQLLRDIRLQTEFSAIQRLRNFCHAYFQFAISNQDYYRLMYRETLVGNEQSEALGSIREEAFQELRILLQECQEQGFIAAGELDELIMACWLPFHGMCSFVIDQHFPTEVFAARLDWYIDNILRGLGCQEVVST